ncbi:choice-of-anchor D domain-containing protein [Myxococcota bacterium]|nr:choice-of-anchor D domain-containing protein [Myxococcota bacterium]
MPRDVRSLLLLPAVPLAPLLGLACNDYNVKIGEPTVALSSEIIDFGEVVVGNQSTIGILVENTGTGPLTIESAELDGTTSMDYAFVELTQWTLDKGQSAELRVRYVPDVVGQDFGRVQLTTNDPDVPITNVDLSGFGVEPEIDLDPDILWFGDVAEGASKTLAVEVSARGTGTLKLTDIQLAEGLAGSYSFSLPAGVGLPYELVSGTSLSVIVSFSPETVDELSGELIFSSNDPHAREAAVQLLGNAVDDPTDNAAPVVSISDPDWGQYFLTDDELTVKAVVYDEEDQPDELVCIAYAGSSPLGTGVPDAAGNVEVPTFGLPAGELDLVLRCLDTGGATGEDSVEISVFNPKEPISYVLSGGGTPFDWFAVDDDVAIYLDGELIYSDTNHTQDTHPPVNFEAEVGQEIRVVVTDYNYCDTYLSTLRLHFGTANSQDGLEGFCFSACPDHECFDGSYAGPWPGVVYEDSFVISIP